MRTLLLSALILLSCALAFAEDPGPKPAAPEPNAEYWDRLHLSGAHAGWVHTVVRTVEKDGVRRIETSVVTDMKMNRLGSTTHIHSASETWELPDGTLLRISTESKMSSQVSKSVFTFKDGKLAVETAVMGQTRTAESEVDKDVIGPAAAARAIEKLAGTKGEVARAKTFIPDFQKVVVSVNTSAGKEKTELYDGSTAELTRIDSVLEGVPGMRPITWVGDTGAVVKTSLAISGMQIDTYRVSTEAQARVQEGGKTPAPDVFAQTMITEADPIPVPRHLDQATIVVRLKDAAVPFPTFAAGGLSVETQEDGARVVTSRRVVPAADKQGTRPLAPGAAGLPGNLKEALASSSMIQADAAAMVETAKAIVGAETNAWKAAQKLERWVFENMTKKNMSVGFASALEALDTREGDCTEHAVLLAALCRAAGIPARVVMGLEFLHGIWGGHAWNDVWIDGAWFQLDGTNGYGFVDPLHLPMAQMVMKEGAESEFIKIIGGLGNLDVDIVSVVRDGRPIPVQDSAKLISVEGGRYCDRIWGLQFDVPPGFVLAPPKKDRAMSAKLVAMDGKTADGQPVHIRIDAMDAPSGEGMTALLAQMRVDPKSASAGTIDGRASRTVTRTRGGRRVVRTLVEADGALYILTLDRAGAEAERKAYDAFLAGIDFDVK